MEEQLLENVNRAVAKNNGGAVSENVHRAVARNNEEQFQEM